MHRPHAESFPDFLRCPTTKQPLVLDDAGPSFTTASKDQRYAISASGIPLLVSDDMGEMARGQQEHYDKVAEGYAANLGYPHTQEYHAYLDRELDARAQGVSFQLVAEICCGTGVALSHYKDRIGKGVGVDISLQMLEMARANLPDQKFTFIQGDATNLPMRDASVDTVFMMGGVHHVLAWEKLFKEIHRVLKPGGHFVWRDPVSDLFIWKWIRAVIYRVSPRLKADEERPLEFHAVAPLLAKAGLKLQTWDTFGFLGFCFFMNSDVLVFNRLFRFIPGIRALTRAFIWLDARCRELPGLSKKGLQVIGVAVKSK